MNNVMNKLLRTIYSVVKNKKVFSADYVCLSPRVINANRYEKKVA